MMLGLREELQLWIERHSDSNVVWYLKRLSASDTLATGKDRTGLFVPRDLLLQLFPGLNRPSVQDPTIELQMVMESDVRSSESADTARSTAAGIPFKAVWRNDSLRGGVLNEARLTSDSNTALNDTKNTGALVVFAFRRAAKHSNPDCHVWVCYSDQDEDALQDQVGSVDPGEYRIWNFGDPLTVAKAGHTNGFWLSLDQIDPGWLTDFPSGQEIIDLAVQSAPPFLHDIDKRILSRRECEYQIFRSIEEAVELPAIQKGFTNIDDFVARAQTILQRRKSRSGRSLELHARAIFLEEGLVEGKHFEFQPRVEGGKAPDYLFPGAKAYDDRSFPTDQLRMLAVKTTCKDRWRQVLNEADRIRDKHLLTLQEGVSENQFKEMNEANLKLVVPSPLHHHFPKSVRRNLISLKEFVAEIKSLGS